MKGIHDAEAHQDILEKFMLPALWEEFGDHPFLLISLVPVSSSILDDPEVSKDWTSFGYLFESGCFSGCFFIANIIQVPRRNLSV